MAVAQSSLHTISQTRRSWLCRAATLAVMCASSLWAGLEGPDFWAALLAFLVANICVFAFLLKGASQWIISGLASLGISFALVQHKIGDYEEAAIIFFVFLLVVSVLFVLVLPVCLVFYLYTSRASFLRRDFFGLISCVSLGVTLGLLNGLLQSYFDLSSDLERMSGLLFPGAQGLLLGLSFHVFHRMNLFEKVN